MQPTAQKASALPGRVETVARGQWVVYPVMKRWLDTGAAFVALILLAPVFPLIALAVKLSSPGPILFQQERLGFRCRPFKLLKFRTMRVGADRGGPLVTTAGDSRVTPVGQFLRQYKLDELPQFYNVLRGDMSIVGPRPQTQGYFEVYRERYERILNRVRPGLTDLATIRFRHEQRELAKYKDPERAYVEHFIPAKLRLCDEYVEAMSLIRDVSIVVMTARAIFFDE